MAPVARRTVDPVCDELEQGEPGTARGVWFLRGTIETYPEDPHLALIRDNIDPTVAVFSVGTSMSASDLAAGRYVFIPTTNGDVGRAFENVDDDRVHCYETARADGVSTAPGGADSGGADAEVVVLLQLIDDETLRLERVADTSCGVGP